jgi:glycosyltransferase involved in cell wall biosynthesis
VKIAEIAPAWIEVPPPGYGGIEWVVACLADGFADTGHDVTLFASGGSRTRAELVSFFDPAPGPTQIGVTYLEAVHALGAYEQAGRFDLIHDHSGFVGLTLATRVSTPVAHTVHGPLNDDSLRFYRMLGERVHMIGISDSQMRPGPDLNWAGRVYNGIPIEHYTYNEDKEDFLLFVGRVNFEKGPEIAVEVAKRLGMKLVMVAAIKEKFEREYWQAKVEPRLTGQETILGEVSNDQKADWMSRARAVLFPIQWPEPFGLVMTESMACGTPVVAFANGAAPEVIADGETGFLVNSVEEMCAAVERIDEISPSACRRLVEDKFSAEAMVRGYAQIFERLIAG